MDNLTVKKYTLKKVSTAVSYKIDYEKELNSAQLEAVKQKDGSILVIAGAGSGKTKTLTYRVARLIEDGVNPKNILLLTFTKKASYEMLSRAALLLDSRCEQVAGGTFHSFANVILRKYSSLLELQNNFTITDRTDSEDIVNHIRANIIGKQEKRFPKKGTILDIYSKAVNKNMPSDEIIAREYKQFEHCTEKINIIIREYAEYKRRNSILDYDDLLLYLRTLLEANPEIRKNSKLFPRDKLIRMAGNSIPVKLLEGIFYQIKRSLSRCFEKKLAKKFGKSLFQRKTDCFSCFFLLESLFSTIFSTV